MTIKAEKLPGPGATPLPTRETSNSVCQKESSEERHVRSGEFLLEQKERKAAHRCVNPRRSNCGREREIWFPTLLYNPS